MKKICIVIANRANYARCKTVMREIQLHAKLKLQLVVVSSALLHRFGDAHKIIEQDGFPIDYKLITNFEGETTSTMTKSTGAALMDFATVFDHLKPDIVVAVADRFEILATAIASRYMNIPLAHIQGGEITGSIDESVRHAITKLANIHFPATDNACERIIKMGENPESVFTTGCPSLDILAEMDLSIGAEFYARNKRFGVGKDIDFKHPYLLVLQHPNTLEYHSSRAQIRETLEAVYQLRMPTVWLWPNIDAGSDMMSKEIRIFRENNKIEFIRFVKNFSPEDYNRVLNSAACFIGNSSSGIREGAFLGVPVVNIGTRQQHRERGENVIDVDYDRKEIVDAVSKQISHGRYRPNMLYGNGDAGKKIVQLLSSWKPLFVKTMTY